MPTYVGHMDFIQRYCPHAASGGTYWGDMGTAPNTLGCRSGSASIYPQAHNLQSPRPELFLPILWPMVNICSPVLPNNYIKRTTQHLPKPPPRSILHPCTRMSHSVPTMLDTFMVRRTRDKLR